MASCQDAAEKVLKGVKLAEFDPIESQLHPFKQDPEYWSANDSYLHLSFNEKRTRAHCLNYPFNSTVLPRCAKRFIRDKAHQRLVAQVTTNTVWTEKPPSLQLLALQALPYYPEQKNEIDEPSTFGLFQTTNRIFGFDRWWPCLKWDLADFILRRLSFKNFIMTGETPVGMYMRNSNFKAGVKFPFFDDLPLKFETFVPLNDSEMYRSRFRAEITDIVGEWNAKEDFDSPRFVYTSLYNSFSSESEAGFPATVNVHVRPSIWPQQPIQSGVVPRVTRQRMQYPKGKFGCFVVLFLSR